MTFSRSSTSLLFLGFLLCRQGLAQGPDFTEDHWGVPSRGRGPWEVNYTSFSNLLDHPNATGEFNLPGPNLTLAYPDAPTDQDWSWTVSVTDDIPVIGTGRSHPDREGKFFTGTRVRLNIPPYIAAAANATAQNKSVNGYDGWEVCVMYWPWDSFSDQANATFPEKFRQDDGSCSSILTSQCIQDWEALAVERYRPGSGCGPPIRSLVESCSGLEHGDALNHSGIGMLFNSSEIGRMYNESRHFDLLTYGGELHGRANTTAYKKTASVPWLTLVLWGRWPATEFSGNGLGIPTTTTAKLACPRARNAAPGSADPNWDGTRASSNTGGSGGGAGASDATRHHATFAVPWLMSGVLLAALL